MSILSVKDAGFSRKAGPLFEHAYLEIEVHDRIGLIGRNGAGKSSLLGLLIRELVPDSGEIAWARNFSYSYLSQNIEVPDGVTLRDFLYLGNATEISAAVEKKERGADPANITRSGDVPTISLENRYRALCRELGLSDVDASLRHFSGGEKKKAALARTLAPYSSLLVLDEPTNHLDVQTIEWLESKLAAKDRAFILVTHDRWFLDSVVNSIVEIDRHTLHSYPGSYSKFLERKAADIASLDRMENKRLANLKIELEWLNRGARARATKSERRKKEIEKMRESLLEEARSKVVFASNVARLGKKVCVMRGLGLSYSARRLFGDFSWELGPGAKVGIVGPNGSGKTSLLRIIAGQLGPTEGSVEIGQTVRMSMFAQTNEAVDGELGVLDFIREHAEHFALPGTSGLDAESLLERFDFPRTFQKQKLRSLSGGEMRRLMLVRVLVESPNFLLLDEPTNDLDIETIESLETYCAEFSGSILMVSHDRLLVDRLADELLVFDGRGQIERFHGSYFDWKLADAERAGAASRAGEAGAPSSNATSSNIGKRTMPAHARDTAPGSPIQASKSNKLSYKEKQELAGLLEEIDALESEKRNLDTFFQDPSGAVSGGAPFTASIDFVEAGRHYDEIDRLIAEKLARWEELAARE
ncbi:MAG: ABC-F family ATP-binding cassette domain-containing protein [Rectinema sp.]